MESSPDPPRRRADLVFQRMPDGTGVLIHAASGTTCALNAPAAEVWELCDGRHTCDDLAAVLRERYEATPQEVQHSVAALLANLRQFGVLE